jgi:hypothetical protein
MKSIILAGNKTSSEIDLSYLKWLEMRVERLAKFSQVLILSNALDETNFHSLPFEVQVKKTPDKTSGALATAGFGLAFLSDDEPFLITPSNAELLDNLEHAFLDSMLEKQSDVGAIVFNGTDPLYSYARLGKNGELIEIIEKRVSGSCALSGFYYFSSKKIFSECLEWAMVNNIQTAGNFFISPALNYFLAKSIEISLFEIPNEDYLRY